jgi:hypothetical protein
MENAPEPAIGDTPAALFGDTRSGVKMFEFRWL